MASASDAELCRVNLAAETSDESKFVSWCIQNGVEAPKLCLSTFDQQLRGVEAVAAIEPGAHSPWARHSKGDSQLPDADSVVVRVPEKVLLSLRTAEGFPKFEEAVRAVGSQLEERAVLSALILWLSTKNSQGFSSWAPYLKVLPKDYTILGAFPKDLEDEFQARLLSPPPQLSDRCLINTLLPGAPAMRALRASEQLAAGAVATRTMHFPGSAVGCLTPFGDMHNYHPPPAPELPSFPLVASESTAADHLDADTTAAAWQGVAGSGEFDLDKREYIIKAGCGYNPGEQVLLCYGRYSNIGLLEHYGFLLPENLHDEAVVPHELWPIVVDPSESQRFFFHPGGCPSWSLLQALRRNFCTPAERSCAANAVRGERISSRNEQQALECISEVCMQVLSSLPTTTRQDQQALAHAQTLSSFRERCLQLALQWRIQYKQSLARAFKMAQVCLAALKEG